MKNLVQRRNNTFRTPKIHKTSEYSKVNAAVSVIKSGIREGSLRSIVMPSGKKVQQIIQLHHDPEMLYVRFRTMRISAPELHKDRTLRRQ